MAMSHFIFELGDRLDGHFREKVESSYLRSEHYHWLETEGVFRMIVLTLAYVAYCSLCCGHSALHSLCKLWKAVM